MVPVIPLVLTLLLATPAAPAQKNRIDTLAQEGFNAIRDGEGEKASVAFRDAILLDPNNAILHFGAGRAARMLGRDLDARYELQRALALDPHFAPAAVLLGQIAYESGELELAIRMYEQAVAAAPDESRLTQQLDEWRKEASVHDSFQLEPGTHFTVLFEGPEEKQLAEHVLSVLEPAYWRIGRAFDAYPPQVIQVILYTREQFRDVTRTPGWVNGAFDGRIRVPVRGASGNERELDRVLTHELVHAIVRSVAGRDVPTWLNEGLAVVFEGSDLTWAERRIKKADSLIPLTQLSGSFIGFDEERASLAYAESALAAKFLTDKLGDLLPQLLQDIAQGQSVESSLARLDLSLADFQQTWERSLGRP
jgi:hypothetical protein